MSLPYLYFSRESRHLLVFVSIGSLSGSLLSGQPVGFPGLPGLLSRVTGSLSTALGLSISSSLGNPGLLLSLTNALSDALLHLCLSAVFFTRQLFNPFY